jgi:hypothetical protein
MHRPVRILHTKEFVKQTADLDEDDIVATWAVLNV